MPIYEFRCETCGHIFEILSLSGGEEVALACPRCGGEELGRLLSRVARAMVGGSGAVSSGVQLESRSCGDGSCSTITLPGHTK